MSTPPLPPNMRFEQAAPRAKPERRASKPRTQSPWQVNVLIALGLVALISALTVFYVRERVRTGLPVQVRDENKEAITFKESSKRKEDAFEEIKLSKADLAEADLELLDDAVKDLERYVELKPAELEQVRRLEELRRRQHIIHAERLRAMARTAEAAAQEDKTPDSAIAQRELARARDAEREIDQKWYFSGMVNKGKITQLETRLRRLEAEPVWRRTRDLEAQAENLIKAKKMIEAEDCLKEAIRIEIEFTEKYRDVLNTEFNRRDKLNARLETIRSFPLQEVLEKIANEAIAEEGLKNWPKASAGWDQAIRQIGQIILQFPQSEYANRSYEAELVRRRNLARTRPEVEIIEGEMRGLRGLLQKSQIEVAIVKARELQARMKKIEINNPGVFPETSPEIQEVDYLTKYEGTLRVVSPLLDRLMLPIPGSAPTQRMLKQEVAQSFYSLVSGRNPSAKARGTAPVESVSYDEARLFCRQLSWISGRTVRLPRLEEIKQAAGDLSSPPARQFAWTFDSTDGLTVMDVATSQPNAAGFYDIIGNVEEWVESDPNTSVATVVGGNVNWVPTSGLPQRQALKKERSRTLGFRFVIE